MKGFNLYLILGTFISHIELRIKFTFNEGFDCSRKYIWEKLAKHIWISTIVFERNDCNHSFRVYSPFPLRFLYLLFLILESNLWVTCSIGHSFLVKKIQLFFVLYVVDFILTIMNHYVLYICIQFFAKFNKNFHLIAKLRVKICFIFPFSTSV